MTESRPVPSAPIFSRVPIPLPGEHIAGYLRRLVTMNRLPSLRYMALLLKVRDIAPRSSDDLWNRLIPALGVPPTFVEPLRWRTVAGSTRRWVSFLGHEIHETFLHHMTIRLCRRCAEDTGTILSVWSLRLVTACPKHGTRLSETCSGCGKRLRFIDALTTWGCNSCGTDYRSGTDEPADDYELEMSRSLAAAAQGLKPAPAPFRVPGWNKTSLQERLTTVEYLGRLVQLTEADFTPERSKRHYLQVVIDFHTPTSEHRNTIEAAMSILSDWPNAYHRLLESLIDRDPNPLASAPLLRRFATTAGLYAIRALKSRSGDDLKLICDARNAFLAKRIDYRPGGRNAQRRLVTKHGNLDVLATTAAREALTRGQATLTGLTIAGFLNPIGDPRVAPLWRVDEVQSLQALIAGLPRPPKGLELMPLTTILTAPSAPACPHDVLLRHVLEGTMPAYSTGATLADVSLYKPDLDYFLVVLLVARWIKRDMYRELAPFNRRSTVIWGPMGHYRLRECLQMVAAGDLRHVNAPYFINGTQQRRFHIGDLVRDIQAYGGPRHFDVDDLENPLRFDKTALE